MNDCLERLDLRRILRRRAVGFGNKPRYESASCCRFRPPAKQKKPTWRNTRRCSTTAAYYLTSPPAEAELLFNESSDQFLHSAFRQAVARPKR
jgi:hypothetical protein